MAYIRAAIVTIFLLACILVGYMVFTFDSEHELNVALESFLKGDNEESERILAKLERDIPSSQYHLYRSYVSRNKKQMTDSSLHLQKAAEISQEAPQEDILLEIYLNQAFNAYLNRDSKSLAEALDHAQNIAGSENEWTLLFTGILDFSNKHYAQTLKRWHEASHRTPDSKWLKASFEQTFSPFWYSTRLARSEIEAGDYLKAREILEKEALTASEEQRHEIDFLLGLSYVREAQDKPINAAEPYYKLAFSYFKRVPMQKELFAEEWKTIASRLQTDLFTLIDQRSFQDIPFYISAFETWNAASELERVSKRLVALLDQEISAGNGKMVQELSAILNRVVKPGVMRDNLQQRFQALVENSLNGGDFSHAEQYWQGALMFSQDPDRLSDAMADAVHRKIFDLIPLNDSTLNLSRPDFALWQRIESNPQARYAFARELLGWADVLWTEHHQEEKAIGLMKLAYSIAPVNDQPLILALIEDQVNRHYEAILQQDSIAQLAFILEAIHQLNLTGINVQDKQEVERQLEDAQTLFANRFYPEALAKATWILRMAPRNQKAMRVIGLVNYRQGELAQALPYLKAIQANDHEANEAFAVCEVIKGDSTNGKRLLDEISKQRGIGREGYLNLGYHALVNQHPQECIHWLTKIAPQDNETLAGISFAHYLLQNWEQAASAYDQLTEPYSSLWGLQGAAVMSRINLNQGPQAEAVLNDLMQSAQESKGNFTPLFIAFKTKMLDPIDRNYVAANFFKELRKDYPKALRHFQAIQNPHPFVLLGFAETYLILNQKEEALRILESFYERSKSGIDIPLEQKALPLLASIYFNQMLYADAVKIYSRYFSIDPNAMEHRAQYAKALMHIRRYDQAVAQYRLLEKANKISPEQMISLLESLIHTDRFDQANALASTLLSFNPPLSTYDHLKIGYLMLLTQNQALFEKALHNIPQTHYLSGKNSQELIHIKAAQGDFEGAAKIAKAHREELSKSSSGLMTLAKLEAGQSRFEQALDLAHQAEQLAPNDISIGDFIGLYERDPESFTRSLQALKKKIDVHPQRISLKIAYARNLIDFVIENQNQGVLNPTDLQKALAVLDQLSLYAQEIPEVYCLEGQAYMLDGRHPEAVDAFCNALKLDKSYAEAYKYLALLQDNPQQAVSLLQDALKFAPHDPETLQQLGLLHESLGNQSDAISAYKKAMMHRPNDPVMRIQLAELSLQNKQPGEAKMALEQVIVLEPSNIHALKLLLRALHDPELSYGEHDLLPLAARQQNIYQALHDLSPQEAEELLGELSK